MTEITHTPPHANLRVADQAGQLACFNCVIETYQTQAYNLARRMLSDWALAEDALQESFVSAYRAFNRLRGEDLAAWVLRIVSNTCRDMLHARKSRPTVSLDPVPDLITEIKGGQHPPGGGCWKSPQGCWPLGRWPAWHSVGEPDAIKAFGVDRPLLCPGNLFSNPSVLNHINDAAKRKSRRNE